MMFVNDGVGRKSEMWAAAACYGTGALLMGNSWDLNSLLCGRAIYGKFPFSSSIFSVPVSKPASAESADCLVSVSRLGGPTALVT